MGMASLEGGLDDARRDFAASASFATGCRRLRSGGTVDLAELSMGMSGDLRGGHRRRGDPRPRRLGPVRGTAHDRPGTARRGNDPAGPGAAGRRGERESAAARRACSEVCVTQSPEKGKANKALIAVMSKQLGLRKSQFALLSGETSREKKFLVREIAPEALASILERALERNDRVARP